MFTKSNLFNLGIWVIFAISCYDVYWIIENADSILENEKNPIGRHLIMSNGGSVSVFVSVKMFTTFMVIEILRSVFKQNGVVGALSLIGMVIIQILVFIYLESA